MMRKRLTTLLAVILLLSLEPICAAERGLTRNPAADTGKRFALVIGNSHYSQLPSLINPKNDAKDISQSLSKLGFSIDLLMDADQETIEGKIVEFGRKLTAGGVGLFYYAGHGIQSKGHNYLIPANAQLRSEKDLRYKAVDVGQVLSEMENANNGFNIVILDACRNNPLASQFRSASRGLTRINAPRGTLVAFATGPGEAAEDGKGRNGTFTKYFLEALKISDISIEQTFKTVLKNVDKETKGRQTPWVSSSFTGDFYFNTSLASVNQASMEQSTATNSPKVKGEKVVMAQTTTMPLPKTQAPNNVTSAPAVPVLASNQIQNYQPSPKTVSSKYKYDGSWEGFLDCGENAKGYTGWRRSITVSLHEHQITNFIVDLTHLPKKKLKKLHHAMPESYFISERILREPAKGSISESGEFNIKYDYILFNDVFDVYLDGNFNGEKFILSGRHGSRDCEMQVHRTSK